MYNLNFKPKKSYICSMEKIHRKVLDVKQLDDNNHLIILKDYSLIYNKTLLENGNTFPLVDRTYTFEINGNEITKVVIFTVDICLFSQIDNELHVLSIIRKNEPYQGCLANPGGFVDENEEENTLISSKRELMEECGINSDLYYINTINKEYRDPRNRFSVTDIYSNVLNTLPSVTAGDDALDFKWVKFDKIDGRYFLPDITYAFDHKEIIRICLNHFNL